MGALALPGWRPEPCLDHRRQSQGTLTPNMEFWQQHDTTRWSRLFMSVAPSLRSQKEVANVPWTQASGPVPL